MDRSGSFGVLFITYETNDRSDAADIIRHEYGHTKQLDELGLFDYFLYIGIPSFFELNSEDYEDYYDRPWEVTANILGDVHKKHAIAVIVAGQTYLEIASSDISTKRLRCSFKIFALREIASLAAIVPLVLTQRVSLS